MNSEHFILVQQEATVFAEWRADNPDVQLDLSRADLSGADLKFRDLSGADLREANLCNADLSGTDLSWANLIGADLPNATLSGANLSSANLTGANLHRAWLTWAYLNGANLTGTFLREALMRGADLGNTNLTDTDLDGASFTDVECEGTTFANVNLSSVEGLNTVWHRGPSTVGIDTLYRSGGKIPEAFLRGCGLPEEFISYLPSLIGAQQAIQFYSCFIYYSHKDEAFAMRLYGRLQQAGLRVWYAPEEMKGGRKLHEQIDEGIRFHDKLLLVLSEESLKSEWVKTEIRRARKAERKEGRQKLFPVRLMPFDPHIKEWECFDADSGKDLGWNCASISCRTSKTGKTMMRSRRGWNVC